MRKSSKQIYHMVSEEMDTDERTEWTPTIVRDKKFKEGNNFAFRGGWVIVLVLCTTTDSECYSLKSLSPGIEYGADKTMKDQARGMAWWKETVATICTPYAKESIKTASGQI